MRRRTGEAWAEEAGYPLSPYERRRAEDARGGSIAPESDPLLLAARVRCLQRSGLVSRAQAVTHSSRRFVGRSPEVQALLAAGWPQGYN